MNRDLIEEVVYRLLAGLVMIFGLFGVIIFVVFFIAATATE